MRLTENLSDMIDRYLAGKLRGEELLRFENMMHEDSGLREEVRLQRQITEAISNYDEIELRDKLELIHRDYESRGRRQAVRKLVQYGRIAAAAAVVILVALASYTWIITPDYSADELFDRYYQPYDVQVFRSGSSEAVTDLMTQAMEKYRDKEFEIAIVLFEQVISADENRMDANLMSGISKIEIENYRAANINFQRIISHEDNMYIEHAEWYLGLCYLITGETEKARDQFVKIVLDEGYYRKEAGRILRKL